MKKHIKKKFLHETELTEEKQKKLNESAVKFELDKIHTIPNLPKGLTTYLTTDDNKIYKAFTYKFNKVKKLIPEPDPILLYFHAAYLNYIQIQERKTEIFTKLSYSKITEEMINELYAYFSVTSVVTI